MNVLLSAVSNYFICAVTNEHSESLTISDFPLTIFVLDVIKIK